MKKVSIKTIAEELNLSRNTVSKALNNSDTVAYETRYRVIVKAAEMGYKKLDPKIKEEFLSYTKKEIKNIIVFVHRDISSFWDEIALGIFDKIDKNEYNVLYSFVSREDEEKGIIPASVKYDNVVGIILLDVFKKDFVLKLSNLKLPMVFLDAPVNPYDDKPLGDVILVEGVKNVYEFTNTLIKTGRKKIGFIGDITYCRTVYDRYQGYAKAMQSNGIPIIDEICLIKHTPEKYYIYEEVRSHLENIKLVPEAFVCCNDDVAMWVIKYYRSQGYKIPEDIAVCGFDNKREAAAIEPYLTTVEIDRNNLGGRLVQELLWRLNNKNMPYETIIVEGNIRYSRSFPEMKK
ncbi:MAG: LacI family transcriptional regulator [Epulopiscium sp.]|nr:LacI family transcriptional regulator [Candidatus Epulonipiscium sp.]